MLLIFFASPWRVVAWGGDCGAVWVLVIPLKAPTRDTNLLQSQQTCRYEARLQWRRQHCGFILRRRVSTTSRHYITTLTHACAGTFWQKRAWRDWNEPEGEKMEFRRDGERQRWSWRNGGVEVNCKDESEMWICNLQSVAALSKSWAFSCLSLKKHISNEILIWDVINI